MVARLMSNEKDFSALGAYVEAFKSFNLVLFYLKLSTLYKEQNKIVDRLTLFFSSLGILLSGSNMF